MKKYQTVFLIALWAALTLCVWFVPAQELSQAERRPLAQMPEFSLESLQSGQFREKFESYSLDQFPLRDTFRTLKSRFHTEILGQRDNNGIYITGGTAVKQEYPLNDASVNHAIRQFQKIYETNLADSQCYFAIVPDKGCYLARPSGHLAMDYDALYEKIAQGLPWASLIDLRPTLAGSDYYRTDTNCRQEELIPAASVLCDALGVSRPSEQDYTQTRLDTPFYGVYYGQAALPMEPDNLVLLENEMLSQCTVYDHETGKTGRIYDLDKLTGRDPYDVYLSGARALLTIENPSAATDRELILFRDSFGSAMAPLLLRDYAKVTLVDIRYVRSEALGQLLDFHGQDVLFLYSTLVLNNSSTLK